MGEEKKPEEAKKTEEVINNNKAEESNKEEKKDGEDTPTPPPPPPPPEIVLRVYMHCEGCARKIRKCLQTFEGVEEVTTDCKTQKVVVKGEKADPLKVLERVQKKTHRHVELLSPLPPPPPAAEEAKKSEEKDTADKPQDVNPQPQVVSVVLKVHMHCEACSLEIKRRIEKIKEVEEAVPDLKSSQVNVKGVFDPSKLEEYVYKRTGKRATIVKIDPPPPEEKKDDEKGGNEEKKSEGSEDGKKTDEGGEKKDGGGGEAGNEGGAVVEEGVKVVEMRRNEFQYYPPRYAMEMYAHPPQIFSDENPNACSIM